MRAVYVCVHVTFLHALRHVPRLSFFDFKGENEFDEEQKLRTDRVCMRRSVDTVAAADVFVFFRIIFVKHWSSVRA